MIEIRDDTWVYEDNMALSCLTLARILERTQNKIYHIDISFVQSMSPEFLALLVAIFNKADNLTLVALEGDAAHACLMASLLKTDGPRGLRYDGYSPSLYQVDLLCLGIARSTCLEYLAVEELAGEENDDETEEAGLALADALSSNRSLKRLNLDMQIGLFLSEIEEIMSAAILETKIEELELTNICEPVEVTGLQDILCSEGCSLKSLYLSKVLPSSSPVARGVRRNELATATNSSVRKYTVKYTRSDVLETVGLFRSIEQLTLIQNGISDLSLLDPLLLGDSATLKILKLIRENVQEEDAIEFFRKLPNFKSLQYLDLYGNRFIVNGNSWKAIAIDAIRRSKILECIDLGRFDGSDDFVAKTCVPLSLNRGGRRALEVESSSVLPPSLWSRVLERASKFTYCQIPHEFDDAEDYKCHKTFEPNTATRADVVYWLLREKMLGQCL